MPQVHFARKTITFLMVLVLISGFMVPGRVTAAGPTVFINEIHYDNNSTDVGEAVEIAGPAGTDLAGWSLVLYNGNGGAPYNTISLSGTIPDLGNGFGVIAVPTVGIQNGSPDGLALVNGSTVVQFLSYEGTFTAVGGPANGMLSVDIGVSEASNSTIGDSLQLVGTGVGYDDFTWAASQPNTFGLFNTGQSFQGTGGPAEPTLNEFVFNHTGLDTHEFVEVYGTPNTDYSAYTLVQIEGDGAGAGVIDSVQAVGTTNAEGFWVTPFLSNVYENNTLTLLMVSGFTGNQGSDLDTDNDGILDAAPWTVEADGIAVSDGGSSDQTYWLPVLDPTFAGGPFAPGGASRIPDGTGSWVLNDFDGAGLPGFTGSIGVGEAYNTPGTANQIYTPPPEACGDPFTPIYTVQGSGPASPMDGQQVVVEGIVTGDFQSGKSGFFIQDASGDGDPSTSDGIFIYAASPDVNVGDQVRIRGTVDEYFNLTEITFVSQVWVCSSGNSIAATPISLPVASLDDFEPYEDMLVTFPQQLYISEYFNFDRYGEIVLTTDRQFTPTAVYDPGSSEEVQLAQSNLLSRITIDDGRSSQNPDPAIHPNGGIFDLNNLFRGGDIVQNVTGVLDYNFDVYKIQPTQGADYIPANPRTAQPDDVGGNLKVASFNVLNYFTTLGSRGAVTPEEFVRQRDKIIAALSIMNADVVGLIEIENNTAAIQDLVDGLNTAMGPGTYAYVDTGVYGTDEIKQAFIYKPATVSLVGDYALLDSSVDPRFIDTKNRPALAQTFQDNATGGIFTAVVNHFKSKGSDCNDVGDPDLGDGAGNCNLTRKAAAEALVDWLGTDPTGSGDADFLIIGDLNSYDKEDPIDALVNGGFTDLVNQYLGEYAYSYVFDGQLGYLDQALASPDMLNEVTGVTIWHINADEPDLIDYTMQYKADAQDAIYAPDEYRSSDHDPVIIGLNVCDEIAPTLEVTATPNSLWPPNHKYVTVQVTALATDNFDPNPSVSLVSVTSNEPDDGLGDGDTPNDVVIVNDFTIQLRAERSGSGTGRIYTLTYQAVDACGNVTTQSVLVTVPKSMGK